MPGSVELLQTVWDSKVLPAVRKESGGEAAVKQLEQLLAKGDAVGARLVSVTHSLLIIVVCSAYRRSD